MTSHFQAIVIRNDTEPLRLSAPGQWDEVKNKGESKHERTYTTGKGVKHRR